MRVLVVGGGGREHALVWKLAQSPRVQKLFCAPGNAGIAEYAERVDLGADDVGRLESFARDQSIDLTVVGPEAPLAEGIVDSFCRSGLRIFGPSRTAARIETSKVFSKDVMQRRCIPTASSMAFSDAVRARDYLDNQHAPIVVKADGPAHGKGVYVAKTLDEAHVAVTELLERRVLGESGSTILIEEYLPGEELSVMALTDGKTVLPLLTSRDYKRIYDRNEGPNTGGMGAFAPVPSVDPELMDRITRDILEPIVDALSSLGSPYRGVLYAGLMLTGDGPKVLECNARFGDPEAQVVLPLLETDLLDLFEAVVEHRLDSVTSIEWRDGAAVCVVLASAGYPGRADTGKHVHGVLEARAMTNVHLFHAGTTLGNGALMTAGGRVLGVTGLGPNHERARANAYHAASMITFDGMQYRTDICA